MSLTEDRRRLMYDCVAIAIGEDIVDDFMNHLSSYPLPELATRDDVRVSETVTRSEFARMRGEISTEMAELRTELKDDMADLRLTMSRRFDAQTRWSAGIVAANLATVVAVLVA